MPRCKLHDEIRAAVEVRERGDLVSAEGALIHLCHKASESRDFASAVEAISELIVCHYHGWRVNDRPEHLAAMKNLTEHGLRVAGDYAEASYMTRAFHYWTGKAYAAERKWLPAARAFERAYHMLGPEDAGAAAEVISNYGLALVLTGRLNPGFPYLHRAIQISEEMPVPAGGVLQRDTIQCGACICLVKAAQANGNLPLRNDTMAKARQVAERLASNGYLVRLQELDELQRSWSLPR